jgi:hypothetical protein
LRMGTVISAAMSEIFIPVWDFIQKASQCVNARCESPRTRSVQNYLYFTSFSAYTNLKQFLYGNV